MPARIAPIAFLLAAVAAFATHGCGKSRQDEHAQQIAARVRTEFLHAWNNYERYAWGHDALRPLSKTAHDWYGQSLLMTPTDSPAHRATASRDVTGAKREYERARWAASKNIREHVSLCSASAKLRRNERALLGPIAPIFSVAAAALAAVLLMGQSRKHSELRPLYI